MHILYLWWTRTHDLQWWLMLAQASEVCYMVAFVFIRVYHIWSYHLSQGHKRLFCVRNIESVSSCDRYSFVDFSFSHWWFQYNNRCSNSFYRDINCFLAHKVLHDQSRQRINKRIRHFNVSFHFLFHLCTNLFAKLCRYENV